MVRKKGSWYALILSASLLATLGFGCATKQIAVTKENLAKAIDAYVKKEAGLKGGSFLVYDSETKKPLILTLEKVHKDRLSRVGDGVYFACADFSTPEGKLYDLDIFMKGPNKEHLEVTEISIHKEDSAERYTWFEKDGIWKKKPLGTDEDKGVEHPEEKEPEPPEEEKDEHPAEHPQ